MCAICVVVLKTMLPAADGVKILRLILRLLKAQGTTSLGYLPRAHLMLSLAALILGHSRLNVLDVLWNNSRIRLLLYSA